MISKTLSLSTVIIKLDFIKRWAIIHWNPLIKKIYCFANKLIKDIADPCNTKEQYQSSIITKTKNV